MKNKLFKEEVSINALLYILKQLGGVCDMHKASKIFYYADQRHLSLYGRTITGDVYINTRGLTVEQSEYNQYAPILMTSVDTDPVLCLEERKAIMQRLGVGNWQIFGAHGFKKDYSVNL